MQDDKADVWLMRNHPNQLLLMYQPVFELIIRKYARNGFFPFGECDEVLQHINERLFSRLDKIVERFDGRVLVRTYLSAICRNMVMEHIRAAKRRIGLLEKHLAAEEPFQAPPHAEMLIMEEFNRLDKVLFLFGDKRKKLWLIMKLVYRIKVSLEDFASVCPGYHFLITEDLISRFNSDVTLKDKEIYALAFPFFRQISPKISHPDTLRKWFNHKSGEVVALMNGIPARAAYTDDTLQILVEKYCAMVESGHYKPWCHNAFTQPANAKGNKMLRLVRRRP